MAGIFTDGVAQVRPGTYFNVDIDDGVSIVGAKNGIMAALFEGTFGPLNQVREISDSRDIYQIYGNGGKSDILDLAFLGGADTVLAIRSGSGGTPAKTQLGEICTITAKYPGTRAFSVTVKDSLTKEDHKEVTIYSGSREIESYSVEKNGSTEGAALKAAMAQSENFTVTVNTDGALSNIAQQASV